LIDSSASTKEMTDLIHVARIIVTGTRWFPKSGECNANDIIVRLDNRRPIYIARGIPVWRCASRHFNCCGKSTTEMIKDKCTTSASRSTNFYPPSQLNFFLTASSQRTSLLLHLTLKGCTEYRMIVRNRAYAIDAYAFTGPCCYEQSFNDEFSDSTIARFVSRGTPCRNRGTRVQQLVTVGGSTIGSRWHCGVSRQSETQSRITARA